MHSGGEEHHHQNQRMQLPVAAENAIRDAGASRPLRVTYTTVNNDTLGLIFNHHCLQSMPESTAWLPTKHQYFSLVHTQSCGRNSDGDWDAEFCSSDQF